MNNFPFEKTFKIEFNYQVDRIPSSDEPTIYIYKDKPSRDIARLGTNAIQSINSWEQSALKPLQKLITVEPINDPDINSITDSYTYYVAINYKLESSSLRVLDIKPFQISRTSASLSNIKIEVSDVLKVYPTLSSYLTDVQIINFINISYDEVKIHFLKQKIDIETLQDINIFYLALAYKTISNASYSQTVERSDKFYLRFEDFEEKYKDLLENLRLPSLNTSGDVVKTAIARQRYKVVER